MIWEDVADLDHELPDLTWTGCWADKDGHGCGAATIHPSGLCDECRGRIR